MCSNPNPKRKEGAIIITLTEKGGKGKKREFFMRFFMRFFEKRFRCHVERASSKIRDEGRQPFCTIPTVARR